MKKLAGIIVALFLFACLVQAQDRVEQWKGKTVMVFTPHPDDDVFGCGGTLSLLARSGNKIIAVIYTNDNKGSFDLEMTRADCVAYLKEQEIPHEVPRSACVFCPFKSNFE